MAFPAIAPTTKPRRDPTPSSLHCSFFLLCSSARLVRDLTRCCVDPLSRPARGAELFEDFALLASTGPNGGGWARASGGRPSCAPPSSGGGAGNSWQARRAPFCIGIVNNPAFAAVTRCLQSRYRSSNNGALRLGTGFESVHPTGPHRRFEATPANGLCPHSIRRSRTACPVMDAAVRTSAMGGADATPPGAAHRPCPALRPAARGTRARAERAPLRRPAAMDVDRLRGNDPHLGKLHLHERSDPHRQARSVSAGLGARLPGRPRARSSRAE